MNLKEKQHKQINSFTNLQKISRNLDSKPTKPSTMETTIESTINPQINTHFNRIEE